MIPILVPWLKCPLLKYAFILVDFVASKGLEQGSPTSELPEPHDCPHGQPPLCHAVGTPHHCTVLVLPTQHGHSLLSSPTTALCWHSRSPQTDSLWGHPAPNYSQGAGAGSKSWRREGKPKDSDGCSRRVLGEATLRPGAQELQFKPLGATS